MARPTDNSLKYYNQDTKDDDNLQYVEAVHGLMGYAIVHKLWKHIYGSPGGYYCEWSNINQSLFCKNHGVTVAELDAILSTCFEDGISIFNKQMLDDHKILTSHGIQKRWVKIVKECGRKHNMVNELYRLISLPTDTTPLTSEETTPPVILISTETPQSKVKESKGKEIKVNKSLKPSHAAPVVRGESQIIWDELVRTWFDFNLQKFKEKPSFTATDAKKLKSISEKLRKRAADKKQPWSIQDAGAKLLLFLNAAYGYNDWLQKNFLLKNLESQFDAVVMNQAGKATKAPVVKVLSLDKLKMKFNDNTITLADVHYEHFDVVKDLGCVITDDHYAIARTKRAELLISGNRSSDHTLAQQYLKNDETPQTKQDKANLDLLAMRYAVRDWLYNECVIKSNIPHVSTGSDTS